MSCITNSVSTIAHSRISLLSR